MEKIFKINGLVRTLENYSLRAAGTSPRDPKWGEAQIKLLVGNTNNKTVIIFYLFYRKFNFWGARAQDRQPHPISYRNVCTSIIL